MAEFAVKVFRIAEPVINHPNADRLTIVKIGGFEAIANKEEDGSFRYNEGDYVVYVPEMAMLPEWLLRKQDMWNEAENKGFLNGPLGNRVKAIKLRGIVSQGVLVPLDNVNGELSIRVPIILEDDGQLAAVGGNTHVVTEGQNLAEILGITKYEPPIPLAMAGEVCNIYGHTMKYDFENLKMVPDIFEPGERVVASEKLHGTNCQLGYIPGLNHPDLFAGGDIYAASKGLGAQGLVLKDNENNARNIYARVLRALLAAGLKAKMDEFIAEYDNTDVSIKSIHIFGEIFGANVQKNYGYGVKEPEFRVFDIAINNRYCSHMEMVDLAERFGLKMVPFLYDGPFDPTALEVFRDGQEDGVKVKGKDALTGTTTREGIVVKAYHGGRHPAHGRKIAKMINPVYLLKTDGEEIN